MELVELVELVELATSGTGGTWWNWWNWWKLLSWWYSLTRRIGITMVYGTPYGFSDIYMFNLGVSTDDIIVLVEIVEMG